MIIELVSKEVLTRSQSSLELTEGTENMACKFLLESKNLQAMSARLLPLSVCSVISVRDA